MKQISFLILILLEITLNACSSNEEILKRQGFQIFSETSIALKCPCTLSENKIRKDQLQKKFSNKKVFAFSCKDSSDAEYLLEVITSDKSIGKSQEQMRDETIRALKDEFQLEKQLVAGTPSICYTYSCTAMSNQIFHEKWNYFLLVHTSLKPKKDLKVMTSSFQFIEE